MFVWLSVVTNKLGESGYNFKKCHLFQAWVRFILRNKRHFSKCERLSQIYDNDESQAEALCLAL